MKQIIPLFVFMVFIIILNTPMSHAELFESQDYGFKIDFPAGWYIDDSLITYEPYPGYDDGRVSFVGAYDDENFWNHLIEVSFTKMIL